MTLNDVIDLFSFFPVLNFHTTSQVVRLNTNRVNIKVITLHHRDPILNYLDNYCQFFLFNF